MPKRSLAVVFFTPSKIVGRRKQGYGLRRSFETGGNFELSTELALVYLVFRYAAQRSDSAKHVAVTTCPAALPRQASSKGDMNNSNVAQRRSDHRYSVPWKSDGNETHSAQFTLTEAFLEGFPPDEGFELLASEITIWKTVLVEQKTVFPICRVRKRRAEIRDRTMTKEANWANRGWDVV